MIPSSDLDFFVNADLKILLKFEFLIDEGYFQLVCLENNVTLDCLGDGRGDLLQIPLKTVSNASNDLK